MTRDTLDTLARSARQLGLDAESFHARVAAFLADQARAPLPPDVLASALQDRIHETSGKLISAKPLKTPAPSPALIASTPAGITSPPPGDAAEHIEEPRQPMQSDGGAGASLEHDGCTVCIKHGPNVCPADKHPQKGSAIKITDDDWTLYERLTTNDYGSARNHVRAIAQWRQDVIAALSRTEPADTAVEGQGLTLPSGWRATTHEDANSPENYEHTSKRCVWGPHGDGWSYCSRPPFGVADGHAPTMLTAMCAALGIELTVQRGLLHTYAMHNGERLCNALDREACAGLALERFHALQQAKTPERAQSIAERNAITVGDLLGLRTDADREAIAKAADDFIAQAADDYERCQCWVGHDSRRPSRWCPVDGHAAEWRTFAEQGTPDLSAEERGHA
jgi:hypothetical protein